VRRDKAVASGLRPHILEAAAGTPCVLSLGVAPSMETRVGASGSDCEWRTQELSRKKQHLPPPIMPVYCIWLGAERHEPGQEQAMLMLVLQRSTCAAVHSVSAM
jgi:hypothetical protein